MTKQFFSCKFPLLFFIIIILTAGCNNNKDDDKKNGVEPPMTDTGKMTAVTPVQQDVTTCSGKLDTLWADSLAFTKVPNGKTVFAFTFGNKDTLTLHGWDAKGLLQNGFDSIPDIRLIKGKASNLTYGPGTYFGNVILNDVKEIKKLLKKENAQYVLFAPQKIGEHISYEIFLSKEDPNNLKTLFAPIDTKLYANPSPPRKY